MAASSNKVQSLTPRKTEERQPHPILSKSPNTGRPHEKQNKSSGCDVIGKCLGEGGRSSAGMCMIVFAVPLLIPGITLTAVAFDDETGFSKYSALHIIGMFMLGLAILLIIVGILLNIRFKSRVAPEDHAVSTHEKLEKQTTDKPGGGASSKDLSLQSYQAENAQPVNFMVDSGNNTAAGDHHVHFGTSKGAVGAKPSAPTVITSQESQRAEDNMDDYSSSYDTSDSEDYSSGSYVISEDPDDIRQSQRYVSEEGDVTDSEGIKNVPHINTVQSTPGDSNSQKTNAQVSQRPILHSVSDTHIDDQDIKPSNNFFQDPPPLDSFIVVSESSDSKSNVTPRVQGGSGVEQDRNKYHESLNGNHRHFQFNNEIHGESAMQNNQQTEKSSPGSRQRLQALSSDTLASPAESYNAIYDFQEENISGSSSSVFSGDKVPEKEASSRQQKTGKHNAMSQSKSDNHLSSWARSASTKRPHSLPKAVRISEASGAITQDNSLTELHVARPQSETSRSEGRHFDPSVSLTFLSSENPSQHLARRINAEYQDNSNFNAPPLPGPHFDDVTMSEPEPLPKRRLGKWSSSQMTSSQSGLTSSDFEKSHHPYPSSVLTTHTDNNEPLFVLKSSFASVSKGSVKDPRTSLYSESGGSEKTVRFASDSPVHQHQPFLHSSAASPAFRGITQPMEKEAVTSEKRRKRRKKRKKKRENDAVDKRKLSDGSAPYVDADDDYVR